MYTMPYERALSAQERAHMRAACLLQTRALLRPQGGSEVNFEILRYVVELDLNFQMLLSLPKTKFPI